MGAYTEEYMCQIGQHAPIYGFILFDDGSYDCAPFRSAEQRTAYVEAVAALLPEHLEAEVVAALVAIGENGHEDVADERLRDLGISANVRAQIRRTLERVTSAPWPSRAAVSS